MRKIIRRGIWLLFLSVLCVTGAEKARQKADSASGVIVRVFPEEELEKSKAIAAEEIQEEAELPTAFDYREEGRASEVQDQGQLGTCWAFAALTALETSLLPEEQLEFSRDHLNFHNSFLLAPDEGGSYLMSVSYLTAWQGPVLERDDPYGDGISPEGLAPVKHVQEVRFPACRDFQAIKQTVCLYGGVESSLYVDFSNPQEDSRYYNRGNFSYCYSGEEAPNHDVVIIGWDDAYPAENFNIQAPGDGAFICQNSWGNGFGEDGVFYVSYYDHNIGNYNVAYTGVEDTDNYDVLYQSDLCGWSGQIGYNSDTASFANVYEASSDQTLRAAGFYATGEDTRYRLAVVRDFEGETSLREAEYVQTGFLQYAGFYTVELEDPVLVEAGRRFAVIVEIMTPEAVYPIAVEYASEELGDAVVLTDGEGYISPDGKHWGSVEKEQSSNLCLKVYADKEES